MTHRPKTAALIAYDAGALSRAGSARIERHLSTCQVCRAELAAARLWTTESTRIRTLSERPPVDFAKMELAIARAAQEQARIAKQAARGRTLERALPLVSLAAAVLLTVGLSRTTGPIVRPAGPPLASLAEAAPSAARTATVMLAAGDVRIIRDDVARPAESGAVLEGGARVEAGVGELHARFAEGTGVAALGPVDVLLAEIDADTIALELDGGRITVEAAMRGSSLFVVLAAAYRIEARVARFVVDLDASSGALGVEVLEGVVTIRSGDDVLEVEGPARWPSSDTTAGGGAVRGGGEGEPEPVAVRVAGLLEGAETWPRFSVAHDEMVRWELDGVAVTGASSLSARVPAGEHEVVGFDASGASFRHRATVGADGMRIEGDALEPDAPRVREGSLPRAVLMSIVGESGARLTHCYEQALRLRALSGDLTARVRLSARGVVMDVRILSDDAPPSLERCVTAEAERWSFPPPGGPMSFDVPLRFRSR